MLSCKALGFCLVAAILSCSGSSLPAEEFKTVRTSNAAILNRLGLVPLVAPDGHHRKRLAGPDPNGSRDTVRFHQSTHGRRHVDERSSPHDSHVYVVKLPASPPYYTFVKPHKPSEKQPSPNASLASPNVGFQNNGKPDKIYHWNLPMVKKINEKKKQLGLLKLEQAKRKLALYKKTLGPYDNLPTVGKPSRNNDKWLGYPSANYPGKGYRLDEPQTSRRHYAAPANMLEGARTKKHRKKAAVSYYYGPALSGKSAAQQNLYKNFPGNGKPKAFYVMEKSRKPAFYHPLMP